MQAITTIGLDIAKSVFQVHGVDAKGNVVLRRQIKRRYVLAGRRGSNLAVTWLNHLERSWRPQLEPVECCNGETRIINFAVAQPASVAGVIFGNLQLQQHRPCNGLASPPRDRVMG